MAPARRAPAYIPIYTPFYALKTTNTSRDPL